MSIVIRMSTTLSCAARYDYNIIVICIIVYIIWSYLELSLCASIAPQNALVLFV